MKRYAQVSGFILAGGASSRMGRDKALLEIDGEPLLVRTARLLEPLVADVTVIGRPERYAALGLRAVPDDTSGRGPLGGIVTALRVSGTEWNLIVGCDLPYLNRAWLELLITRALASPADALVPETRRGLEPLCAMYRARSAAALGSAVTRGEHKVTDAVAKLAIEKLGPAEWGPIDPEGELFKNMNTPADYEEVRAQLEGKRRS
ncbi:MAG TPA: molybdenum cofactor guanylyltransferase [Candidatus Acidoferrales bacterium]|nr:molybdenum cofactor guanylyltransferase [Candidatus Acidoferrales bacterium]